MSEDIAIARLVAQVKLLQADCERLRQCLQDVVNTSGRTREVVVAEELLTEADTTNEDEQ